MDCKFITSFNTVFSREKRNAVYIALGGVYNCVACKTIHKLTFEEEENHAEA